MKSIKKILETVELTRKRHALFHKNDAIVLAVSGGPDSIALLRILLALQKKYSLKLVVAHVNHGLWPQQAKRHEALVRQSCEKLGLPFRIKRIKLKEIAKRLGRSLEEAGRIERYRFFEKIAGRFGCQSIATAHTRDDQAETVLLRIIRGSGIKGLSGIPYKRAQGRFAVVRPLLDVEKSALVRFLRKNGLRFCIDRTNRDTTFLRNRVRRRLLHVLEHEFNPNIKSALASLQRVSQEIQDCLDGISSIALQACRIRTRSKRRATLHVKKLQRYHPAIQREVILRALTQVKGDTRRVGFSHLAAVADMLRPGHKPLLETHLPGFVCIRLRNNRLIIDSRFK